VCERERERERESSNLLKAREHAARREWTPMGGIYAWKRRAPVREGRQEHEKPSVTL